MSFLKITDPTKRDQTVKEYLELKKNIRNNLLSERAGEQQLQTELTKFYRPITELQKATTKEITESQRATAREITEGLRPIREGIENLPLAMQPIGEASGEAPGEEEDEPVEEEEEEEDKSIGPIARHFLNKPNTDKTFGVRKEGKHHYIGNKHVIITRDDDIIIKESGDKFFGSAGLWGLITSKEPDKELIDWDKNDIKDYEKLMIKTNALHRDNNPKNPYPKSSSSKKWLGLLSPIWTKYKAMSSKKFDGKGVVIMSSNPNALLETLDLLLASQKAGHTGVGNELVSICDELKRQGVLDASAYKKLNSIIKNDST